MWFVPVQTPLGTPQWGSPFGSVFYFWRRNMGLSLHVQDHDSKRGKLTLEAVIGVTKDMGILTTILPNPKYFQLD